MINTPWNRVLNKLLGRTWTDTNGVSWTICQSDIAYAIGCSRSTITKGKQREPGLVSGTLQARLVNYARNNGVELTLEDFLP